MLHRSETAARPRHGQQGYEFHGQMHTWRDGHGWTVEYTGCIVHYNNSYDLPPEAEDLPIGRYEVDDDWTTPAATGT